MSRPIAKRMYAQKIEDYFDKNAYYELEVIILGNDIHYDEILKDEAKREFEYRNELIKCVDEEEIDELNNDEFMQIYALLRADKSQVLYEKNTVGMWDVSKSKSYYPYFGETRNKMLKACETELNLNRKFLINKFLLEYCE